MAAYVIYQATVNDPERYEEYKQAAAASVAAAGGRYLARGGEIEGLEGDAPHGRVVILEFPDRRRAHDWYHGGTYEAARSLRAGAAEAQMFIVDGVSG